MDVKNVLTSCLATSGNTGFGECFTDIGMPRGLLFVPKGSTWTTASIAALKTALEAAILADSAQQRIFPLGNIVNVSDNTEKPVIQTFNTGAKSVVRPGFYDLTLQWEEGGFCVLYALLQANGRNMPFLIYTDKGLLLGVDAGAGLMKGINPNLVYVFPFTFSDGTKVTAYELNINFEPSQINQNIAFVDFNGAGVGGLGYLEGLEGLQNVTLNQLVAPTATVFKIGATSACGSADLHGKYATELATPSAWVAKDVVTGALQTISGVVDDPTDGGWALTVTTPTANIAISLAGPTELAALGVVRYQSNSINQAHA